MTNGEKEALRTLAFMFPWSAGIVASSYDFKPERWWLDALIVLGLSIAAHIVHSYIWRRL